MLPKLTVNIRPGFSAGSGIPSSILNFIKPVEVPFIVAVRSGMCVNDADIVFTSDNGELVGFTHLHIYGIKTGLTVPVELFQWELPAPQNIIPGTGWKIARHEFSIPLDKFFDFSNRDAT